MTTLFNENQLATYKEAQDLRDYLNSTPFFTDIKVLPGDDSTSTPPTVDPNFPWLSPAPAKVGIYLPSWASGPGGFPEPFAGDKRFLHFRFSNGFSGMNVGLALDKFRRFPGSSNYVLSVLAQEIA